VAHRDYVRHNNLLFRSYLGVVCQLGMLRVIKFAIKTCIYHGCHGYACYKLYAKNMSLVVPEH
jgi:hypothetical protein